MSAPVLGQGIVRKDGVLKVTGGATYTSDNRLPRMAYASLVRSTIPAGRIDHIDAGPARAAPGVLAIVTHENAPRLHPPGGLLTGGEFAEHFFPLQEPEIYFWGQYVAVVVADTLERAEDAAARVRVSYTPAPFETDMENHPAEIYEPSRYLVTQKLQIARGDVEAGKAAAEVSVHETYRTPYLNHNPMEPHATVADWTDGKLTIYEPTQWVMGLRSVVSKSFALKAEQVHIISPFVGGGFGGKGFSWPHTLAAAMASREAARPVKLVLSRAEMFASVGHRGPTRQELILGAKRDGRLTAIQHATFTSTSIKGNHVEACGLASSILYACTNVKITHRAARVNTGTPCPMRAPGEAPGLFALESAMDELALKLGLDPIELRLQNYAEEDPEKKQPWSSKHLRECYRRGAELFGWERRQPAPGSMQQDGELVGLGMATATYPANRRDGSAAVRIHADGRVVVRSATHDLGTGTYTTLAQVAADELGVPIGQVTCELGDSLLPKAGVSGGSSTSASIGPLVQEAARQLKEKLRGFPSVAEAVNQSAGGYLETRAEHGMLAVAAAELLSRGPSAHSFGAHFVEVRINPDTRQIRVHRVVAVIDGGRIMNSLTARSQIQGGIVWGIGMTLLERTDWDPRTGTPVTRNLADYLLPVNADVPDITVEFTDYPDLHFNPLGVRGIGEIGITGVTAAIANAVHHATGVRVRDLPITLDKILV
jgi:xanthine dehydrogenase YagR molybdenum-binding subunit